MWDVNRAGRFACVGIGGIGELSVPDQPGCEPKIALKNEIH